MGVDPIRLAWLSPFPPVRTGIAGRSADTVAALRARGYRVDAFDERAAHDLPWKHRRRPYDLIIYQFGNSSHHDYEWPYAFRYPGLVVLHDTHLHHARAALLLREQRAADYRAEFAWSHPHVPADAAELAVAGFDSRLYYDWPMVRGLVVSSRLTAVHGEGAREELIAALSTPHSTTPNSTIPDLANRIVWIRLGEGEPVSLEREARARAKVRAAHQIADDAVVFGCFGGISPEKRVPQILAAFRATLASAPGARLLLAGAPASHYDVAADVAAGNLQDRVTLTGYLETDAELTDYLAACDVSLNLRWPTARETSGPWLRAIAAGKPTIVTDLVHMTGLASLDPRTWTVREVGGWALEVGTKEPKTTQPPSPNLQPPSSNLQPPVCVAIDILDEDHSLRLAMRRLATDAALRVQLGAAARTWWSREHSLDVMVDDYERVIAEAIARPVPADRASLPAHLRATGDEKLETLLAPFGIESPLDSK